MSKKLKIFFAVLIVSIFAATFWNKEKPFVKVSEVVNGTRVKARQIRIKSGNVLFVKIKFKNAGVLCSASEKHGISAVVSSLLCRRIKGLSPEETKEKLAELGIENLSVNALGDDFTLSFYVLKDKVASATQFLSSIFFNPEFSKNDLEFIKEKYPAILDVDTSHPQELLFDKLMSMLYRNHNYGLNNMGTAQAVSSITEDDVRDFIKSNFAKDNLEVFFTGNISQSDIETYIETLFSKLPDKSESKPDDMSSSALSEEKEAVIHKNNMENIVGATLGVRLGKLNKQEKAAAHMIIESLFDERIGDFNEGLRSRNIAYGANVRFMQRRLSSVFYFTVYIDEKDLKNCKKYLQEKMSAYRELKPDDLDKILSVKKRLTAPSQNGFANITNIEEKMKYNSLPFEEVTREILSSVAKKLFDESQTRIVYIMR